MNQEKNKLSLHLDSNIDYTLEVYKYCKQYYPNIIKICEFLYKRAKFLQYDNQVSIEGETGSGKSMFTLILACCYQAKLGRKLCMEDQCLFVPDEGELKREIRSLKEFDIYWIDEAIRALDKKRWFNKDQIDINHIVKTERWRRNTIFYLIQRFSEFTESFRNFNIYWRIYIVPHYAAILYAKDIDKDIEDPWHGKHNLSIKYKTFRGTTRYKALLTPEFRLKKEQNLPNYVIDTRFPNLEEVPHLKPMWDYYQNLKELSRVKLKEIEDGKRMIVKNKVDLKYREAFKLMYKYLLKYKKVNPAVLHKEAKLGALLTERSIYKVLEGMKPDDLEVNTDTLSDEPSTISVD